MLFIKFGKFSAIICFNIFFCFFSFSSPSDTPIINMLLCIMVFCFSLRLSLFIYFFILFSLPSLDCIISILKFIYF